MDFCVKLFSVLCLLCSFRQVYTQTCSRIPKSRFGRVGPKAVGSNGFGIVVIGNHTKYIPGKTYTVRISGLRSKSFQQKFEGFFLAVEPSGSDRTDSMRFENAGRFRLFGEALTRFSTDCPNMVTHTSSDPKNDISVMWIAPSQGSGCVFFRATVVERNGLWYKDDGALSYKLCEQVQENQDEQPPTLSKCCTCDEAKYEITFEGLWSRYTHPKDFPRHDWDTAFSDLIGASHSSNYRFWEYSKRASEGVRQVAEWGDTKKLESELKNHSSHVRTIIKARGLEQPKLHSRTFAVFRVDKQHHQASVISRIKPSPDWVVGVSAMELCLRNCSWTQRQVLNLRPWDVGTSNGHSYLSSSNPTIPKQKIQRITHKWPLNSPFYDPNGKPIPPLARLVFQRQRVYKRSCNGELYTPNRFVSPNQPFMSAPRNPFASSRNQRKDNSVDCSTTRWSPWSSCSSTCGPGSRTRSRQYHRPSASASMGCTAELLEYDVCYGNETCGSSSRHSFSSPISDSAFDMCALTEWSLWSPCSSSCGPGTRSRRRSFKNSLDRKRCPQIIHESEPCIGTEAVCDSPEVVPPGCEVTLWSEWSPCSVSCGKEGEQIRKRMYMSSDSKMLRCDVNLKSVRKCTPQRSSCDLNQQELDEICRQPLKVGSCRGSFNRYYYDPKEGRCLPFNFSGCKGNKNNFISREECTSTCENKMLFGGTYRSADNNEFFGASQAINPLKAYNSHSRLFADYSGGCTFTEWSEWSGCSRSCGVGSEWRHRQVLGSSDSACRDRSTEFRTCNLSSC